jgi:uncharacterized protein YqeY
MSLHERIKEDLSYAIKNKSETLNDLKYILGEFSRLKGTKDGKEYIGSVLSDTQVIRVLKLIVAGEDKLIELVPTSVSTLKPLINTYLPKQISELDLLNFISTIDFSTLGNKMQAVKIIKSHFGASVDGKLVSDLIQKL